MGIFTADDERSTALEPDAASPLRQPIAGRYGSFYLRVGAVAFGIGSMVYSGLELGQYFELKGEERCQNALVALTPAARTVLSIVQMQFIFLNTKQFEMHRHKVIARFGLMHMVATNLCEWLYVLVEETKHEILHLHGVGTIVGCRSGITIPSIIRTRYRQVSPPPSGTITRPTPTPAMRSCVAPPPRTSSSSAGAPTSWAASCRTPRRSCSPAPSSTR